MSAPSSRLMEAMEKIGRDAKTLITSDLGFYLDGCLKQDIDDAKEELIGINAYEFTDIRLLQNKIVEIQMKAMMAERIKSLLAEAISLGNEAIHTTLENEDG